MFIQVFAENTSTHFEAESWRLRTCSHGMPLPECKCISLISAHTKLPHILAKNLDIISCCLFEEGPNITSRVPVFVTSWTIWRGTGMTHAVLCQPAHGRWRVRAMVDGVAIWNHLSVEAGEPRFCKGASAWGSAARNGFMASSCTGVGTGPGAGSLALGGSAAGTMVGATVGATAGAGSF